MPYSLRDIVVIHEDNHLLATNKPPGLLSQGDHTGDPSALDLAKQYIKIRYEKPGNVFLHPVHRLDRPVSGALLMARTGKALSRMNQLFRDRKVQKTYYAVTRNIPDAEEGRLEHYLLKDRTKNITRAYDKKGRRTADAKKAILHWKLLSVIDHHYLLEIKPLTGRPHQIRAQLAAIGCPIVGDIKYGSKSTTPDHSIALHSRRLEFTHPVKKTPVLIEAELPQNEVWKRFR